MNNENSFVEFKTLIDRLKLVLNITTDTNIAECLYLSYQSFAQMKRRNSLPYENVLILCKEHDLNPLKILECDDNKFNIYYESIINNNALIQNIKLLDSEEHIAIPNLNAKESYRAYILNRNIYIVDSTENELKHNQTYIIQKNKIFYKKHITVNIDGKYILTEPDTENWVLSEDEINKLTCIAKVLSSYIFNTYNDKYANNAQIEEKLTQLINLALKNDL